jgi:hypothetical protein
MVVIIVVRSPATVNRAATAIDGLLDPARHTGLSAGIARAAAERARATARDLTGPI